MGKKNIPKKKVSIPDIRLPVLLLPGWLVIGALILWIYFVLSRYYAAIPFGSLSPFFAQPEAIALSAFFGRLGSHILNGLFAMSVFVAAFGAGGYLHGYLLPATPGEHAEEDDPRTRIFFSTVLGLGALALATALLGFSGLLYRPVFLSLIALGVAAGIRRLLGTRSWNATRWTLTEKAGVAVFLGVAAINLIAALTPETFFDSQLYQLGVLNYWRHEHRIAATPFVVQSYFPFNVNMLYLVALVMHNEITAKLVHYLSGLLLSFGIYALGRKYFSSKAGVFAALIFYSVPWTMVVSSKTAVELGIGLFEFSAVFSLVMYAARRHVPLLILAGIFCGFSLGSKYTSIIFCYVPALILIGAIGIRDRARFGAIVRDMLFFSAAAAIVCSVWYLRTLILTGNPVFPYLWDKLGHGTMRMTGSLLADPPHPRFSLFNYALFLWPYTMGVLQQESFPGPVFLAFVPLLFLLRRTDARVKLLLAYMAGSLVFWIVFGRFYLRYFIPTLPVVSLVFAYYITEIPVAREIKHAALFLIMVMAYGNAAFGSGIFKTTQSPLAYVLGQQSEKEYLSTARPSYPNTYYQTLEYANAHVPENARILFIGESRGLYSRRRFLVGGPSDFNPLVEWIRNAATADEVYTAFRAQGVTHFILNVPEAKRLSGYDIIYWEGKEMAVFDAFWRKYVRETYRDIGDLSAPERGIGSMKVQQPAWWQGYSSMPENYVYLYEIMSPEDAGEPHAVPRNFLIEPSLYSKTRWERIVATLP